MSWVRFDDQCADHPKILRAGALAGWLWFRGMIYCGRYLTDGFIPEEAVSALAGFSDALLRGVEPGQGVPVDPMERAAVLVKVGLWERREGGFQVHDYLKYQPSRREVMQEREFARRRSAMNNNPTLMREIRARDGDCCRYCGRPVNWRDRKSPTGGTYDHVRPITKGGKETVGNLVVSCRECNLRKGGRLLREARMTLLARTESHGDQAEIKTESGLNPDNPSPSPSPSPSPKPRPDPDPGFKEFWSRYPKKVGKDDAHRKWQERKCEAHAEDILAALERQRAYLTRDNGQYVPNPATWLHQGRWQDEPPEVGPPEKPRLNAAWEGRQSGKVTL